MEYAIIFLDEIDCRKDSRAYSTHTQYLYFGTKRGTMLGALNAFSLMTTLRKQTA